MALYFPTWSVSSALRWILVLGVDNHWHDLAAGAQEGGGQEVLAIVLLSSTVGWTYSLVTLTGFPPNRRCQLWPLLEQIRCPPGTCSFGGARTAL